MSAASTSTSSTAPDVNNARAAYSACIPEAHDELNTGNSSLAHGVSSSSAFVSKASSQRPFVPPLHEAINNGVLPAPQTSKSARLASARQRATSDGAVRKTGKHRREMFDRLASPGHSVAVRNDCELRISTAFPCVVASAIRLMAIVMRRDCLFIHRLRGLFMTSV